MLDHYIVQVRRNPPRDLIKILVKACPGMFSCRDESLLIPHPSFTDGLYVILGGQHIALALRRIWEEEGGQRNDANVDECIKHVAAEVLRVNTPIELCKVAAAQHQFVQGDFHGLSTAEIFAFFHQTSLEKQTKFGTRILLDKEVGKIGMNLGLQQFFDRHGKLVPVEKQVYNPLTVGTGRP
jgi:hypothetical protein